MFLSSIQLEKIENIPGMKFLLRCQVENFMYNSIIFWFIMIRNITNIFENVLINMNEFTSTYWNPHLFKPLSEYCFRWFTFFLMSCSSDIYWIKSNAKTKIVVMECWEMYLWLWTIICVNHRSLVWHCFVPSLLPTWIFEY